MPGMGGGDENSLETRQALHKHFSPLIQRITKTVADSPAATPEQKREADRIADIWKNPPTR